MPNPVEPPGQPPRVSGLQPSFRPQRAASSRVGHYQGNGMNRLCPVTSSMERLAHLIERAEPVLHEIYKFRKNEPGAAMLSENEPESTRIENGLILTLDCYSLR